MLLSAADSKRLAEAFRLLQQKRAREASVIASEVATRSPQSADALHMLALCSKALGDNERAAATFEAACALAPDDPNLLGNYANLLGRMGRATEAVELYRKQLSLAPAHPDGWMNLGLGLIDIGDFKGACDALERAVTIRPRHAPAWHGLGSARRGAGDLQGAEATLRQAVSLDPANAAAWISLGVLRRLLGDPTDSLTCYDKARDAGFAGPEIEDAEASACLDLGEPDRALAAARRLTQAAPGYAPGQSLLAHILWEHGASLAPREDPLASFREALAEQPSNTVLRHEFIRFLLAADKAGEALEQIRSLRAQSDTPPLVGMEANTLEILGDHKAAAAMFAAAYTSLKSDAGFLNLYVRHLLRKGSAEQAAAYALDAHESEPHNQLSLAYLSVAWRLLGDAREDWLCGYDRLVSEVIVETPQAFADPSAFLRAVEAALLQLHTAGRAPVNQSLRGGSQTSGVLFGRRDPVIAALRDAIHEAVLRYAGQLPDDPGHPFLRRKSTSVRFAGSWSVRLWSSGRHVNHYHQEGWISSAYYVSLPPSVAQASEDDTAGCIQFGQPPAELGLALAPRRVIRPRAGGLVLFPSYLWHGTVPFEDDAPRLTVAFDAVPTQGAATR